MSESETTKETTEDEGKVAIKVNKDNYVKTKSASGKASLRRDEPVAEALAGLDIDAIYDVGKTCLEEDFRGKYVHLNVGMQRMNVGNRLRTWVNGEPEPKEGEEAEDRLGQLQDACANFRPVKKEESTE
jgi:hypothetical protein|tara:strand:+ start:2826 stop:3212 length:387 start_codon:yes stop_codon:yes gene_type:complete